MDLPVEIRPSTDESLRLPDGQEVIIPKTTPAFNLWTGAKLMDTFGGKAVLQDVDGPCFGELLVYRFFLRAGWSARWIEPYSAPPMNPRFLTAWDPMGLKAQKHEPIADGFDVKLLDSIAQTNGNTYSGCWDVLAWHGKEVIFAELKLKAHDKIRETQLKWLQSALKMGLTAKNFLLVEWSQQ